MEPSEEQYLAIDALDTLDLLIASHYDEETGNWYIYTVSPVLSIAMILQNGEIVPTTWEF